jgi:hypothetical protein
MQITYQLSESEFTYDFFRSLKRTLKGKKKVEISVIADESPYKISKEAFEKKILTNEKSKERYNLSPETFDNLLVNFENDVNFNPIEELKKHKVTLP